MKELLRLLSLTYYTLPIMAAIQILAFLIAFHNRKKFLELRFFHFYPLAAILQVGVSLLSIFLLHKPESKRMSEGSINLFSFIEAVMIYHLAFRVIKIAYLRTALKAILILFL